MPNIDLQHPILSTREIASQGREWESVTNIRLAIDVITARQRGRNAALALGFDSADVARIAAAISEVARNIVEHAQCGLITLQFAGLGRRIGLKIIAQDRGPGIKNVGHAIQFGHANGQSLGVGLPGAKWLMDEFEVESIPGVGTTVTMTKWVP